MNIAARNAAASDAQSVTTSRRTGIAWIEIFCCVFFRQYHVYPSTDRTAHAHVSHRGTPGVRSLQEERHNT